MITDWNNLFKIRIANSDKSFQKHEVVKLLVVMKILNQYRNKSWIRVYTEFKLNGMTPDIYFENIRTKSVVCYEIQKNFSKTWLKKKTEQYNNYEIPYFTLDFIPIQLKKLSSDIVELNKQLDEFIF
ncbi:hypothetical protein LCGC14_0462320 [marine sediment metagenome]|uniref:DUF4268 domain-containing protein n=1 Tax=marine sediment metagenome TaxID=412755 RepID=A0A0F9VNM7_9ZZZZ